MAGKDLLRLYSGERLVAHSSGQRFSTVDVSQTVVHLLEAVGIPVERQSRVCEISRLGSARPITLHAPSLSFCTTLGVLANIFAKHRVHLKSDS